MNDAVTNCSTQCVSTRWNKSRLWGTIKWQTSPQSVVHRHHHASLSIHPPPTTKAELAPTDSCTSLPLWLTQLGFSSFIFSPLFKQKSPTEIHPATGPAGELMPTALPLSQTLSNTSLFLWFNSILTAPPPAASRRLWAERQTGGEPGRQTRWHQPAQEVFLLFLTADRKRAQGSCHNNSAGGRFVKNVVEGESR